MISSLVYSKGDVKRAEFSSLNLSNSVSWIKVKQPSLKEIELISQKTEIPNYMIRNFLDKYELPRVEDYKDNKLIILKTYSNGKQGTFGAVLSKKYLITIFNDDITDEVNGEDFKKGVDGVLYRILESHVKDYAQQIEEIEDSLDNAESVIFKRPDNQNIEEVFMFRRKLIYLRKVLTANKPVIEPLAKDNPEFLLILTEINQQIEREVTESTRLTTLLDMHMNAVSNNLNAIMKKFTVIAALILLPTLVSGIYGMNFKFIPLAEKEFGFYFALLIMLGCVVLMFLYFKGKKWV